MAPDPAFLRQLSTCDAFQGAMCSQRRFALLNAHGSTAHTGGRLLQSALRSAARPVECAMLDDSFGSCGSCRTCSHDNACDDPCTWRCDMRTLCFQRVI